MLFRGDQRRATVVLAPVVVLAMSGVGCVPEPAGEGAGPGAALVGEAGGGAVDAAVGFAETDDVARFLAGMPGGAGSPLRGWRSKPWWAEHARRMDWLWGQHEAKRGRAIAGWRGGKLGMLDGRHYLFYPFSGPDFVFANAFFPRATHYLLCGLESCESMPDLGTLGEGEVQFALENLRGTLDTYLQHSYFITKEMRGDLARGRLRGTAPVFLALLARSGHRVESMRPVAISGAGTVETAGGGGSSPGLHFVIRPGGGGRKHLFYFRQNLADGGLGGKFKAFAGSMGHPVTFIKSASYLMHGGGFSGIRSYILDESAAVVQTPSGIPFRHYDPERWEVRLYGNYVRTLDMFGNYYQADLAQAFRSGAYPVEPIGFGLGYVFYEGESSMLIARRKAISW